jgi:hypothetical protein
MTNSTPSGLAGGQITSIIKLARCSAGQRILLAGVTEPARIHGWHSRGYHHVATTATCRLPRGQYDVAAVEWRQHSIKALETTLDWLVHFLSPRGVLVIWVDKASDTPPARRKLRSAVERLGFHVEARRRCQSGYAISARRTDTGFGVAPPRTTGASPLTAAGV